jgi:hypothetical protein
MGPRLVAVAVVLASCATLALGAVSCSSSNKSTSDASVDSSGVDSSGNDDGGADTMGDVGDEVVLKGGCEDIDGSCDLVLQNCAAGKQCVQFGTHTQCASTSPKQHIAKGYLCCPGRGDCAPGLQCLGGPPCTGPDAGPPAGGARCTPACCQGDDTPCGNTPEGFQGTCNLRIENPNNTNETLYWVCLYVEPCKPFGIQPCPVGDGCYVIDNNGGFECAAIYNNGGPPAGEGAPCQSVNSCADGLDCLGSPDGGFACTMICYTGKGNPPFNANQVDGGPYSGGCSKGKTCMQDINYPAWLGICL